MPYLTPGVMPSTRLCRRLFIPNDLRVIGAVSGALLTLTHAYNWESEGGVSPEDMAYEMLLRVEDFLHSDPCSEETTDAGECNEYQPPSSFIAYAPNDPFQSPDFTPEGYFVPPWYNNPTVPLPGVLPGDAMVNALSIAVFGDLASLVGVGLPRASMTINGAGVVEVEFVRVPQGGEALVVIDSDLLNAKLIDLDSVGLGDLSWFEDIFNVIITASANITEVVEFGLVGEGQHTIDITFVPKVDTETLIGFGGGIRRVSLCGVDLTGETVMPQMRATADGCGVEWRPNSSSPWIVLVDDLCGDDGTDGTDGTDGASAEMRVDSGWIQWRQSDNNPTWTNLVSLASLQGAQGIPGIPGTAGADGASVELRKTTTHVQWRQSDDNPTWTNLIALADLKGDQGEPGEPGQPGEDAAYPKPYYTPSERIDVAAYMTRALVEGLGRALGQAQAFGSKGEAFWVAQQSLGSLPGKVGTWAAAVDSASNADLAAAVGYITNATVYEGFVCDVYVNLPASLNIDPTFKNDLVNDWAARVSLTFPSATTAQKALITGGLENTREAYQALVTSALIAEIDSSPYGDECMPDFGTAWARYWNFDAGSYSTTFQFTNATYQSGWGYTPTNTASTMIIRRQLVFAVEARASFYVSTGDRIKATFIDVATGLELASIDHTESPGNLVPDLVWEGNGEMYCENGIELRVQYFDLGAISFGFVQCLSIAGVNTAPSDGGTGHC